MYHTFVTIFTYYEKSYHNDLITHSDRLKFLYWFHSREGCDSRLCFIYCITVLTCKIQI